MLGFYCENPARKPKENSEGCAKQLEKISYKVVKLYSSLTKHYHIRINLTVSKKCFTFSFNFLSLENDAHTVFCNKKTSYLVGLFSEKN